MTRVIRTRYTHFFLAVPYFSMHYKNEVENCNTQNKINLYEKITKFLLVYITRCFTLKKQPTNEFV